MADAATDAPASAEDWVSSEDFDALERWIVRELVARDVDEALRGLGSGSGSGSGPGSGSKSRGARSGDDLVERLCSLPLLKAANRDEVRASVRELLAMLPAVDDALRRLGRPGFKTWIVGLLAGPLLSNASAERRRGERASGTPMGTPSAAPAPASGPPPTTEDPTETTKRALVRVAEECVAEDMGATLCEELASIHVSAEARASVRDALDVFAERVASRLEHHSRTPSVVQGWARTHGVIPWGALAAALKMHVGSGLVSLVTSLLFARAPFGVAYSPWERIAAEIAGLDAANTTLSEAASRFTAAETVALDAFADGVAESPTEPDEAGWWSHPTTPESVRARRDAIAAHMCRAVPGVEADLSPQRVEEKRWAMLRYVSSKLHVRNALRLVALAGDARVVQPMRRLLGSLQSHLIEPLTARGSGTVKLVQLVARQSRASFERATDPATRNESREDRVRAYAAHVRACAEQALTVLHNVLRWDASHGSVVRETATWAVASWSSGKALLPNLARLRDAARALGGGDLALVRAEAAAARAREVRNARAPPGKKEPRPHFPVAMRVLGGAWTGDLLDAVWRGSDAGSGPAPGAGRGGSGSASASASGSASASASVSGSGELPGRGELIHVEVVPSGIGPSDADVDAAMRRRGYDAAGEAGVWFRTRPAKVGVASASASATWAVEPIVDVRVVGGGGSGSVGDLDEGWIVVPGNLNKGSLTAPKRFLAYRRRSRPDEPALRGIAVFTSGSADADARGEELRAKGWRLARVARARGDLGVLDERSVGAGAGAGAGADADADACGFDAGWGITGSVTGRVWVVR